MTGIAKLTKTFILFLTVFAIFSIAGIDIANACGWGQGGGQGYVPQRRDPDGFLAQKQALTEEQARDIVTKYVKRLNPTLDAVAGDALGLVFAPDHEAGDVLQEQ